MTDDPAELPIKEYIARGVAEGALAAAQHVRLAVDQLAGRGRLGRHGVIGQHVLRRIGMPGVSQGVIDGPVAPGLRC